MKRNSKLFIILLTILISLSVYGISLYVGYNVASNIKVEIKESAIKK